LKEDKLPIIQFSLIGIPSKCFHHIPNYDLYIILIIIIGVNILSDHQMSELSVLFFMILKTKTVIFI